MEQIERIIESFVPGDTLEKSVAVGQPILETQDVAVLEASPGMATQTFQVARTVTQQEEEIQLIPHDVAIVLDTSPSMRLRMEAARNAIRAILESLTEVDRVAFVPIRQETPQMPLFEPRPDVDFWRDVEPLCVPSDTQCQLYDALLALIDSWKSVERRPDAQLELVLVTDGRDGASEASFLNLWEAVKHPGIPNFHILVLAVALDQDVFNIWKELVARDEAGDKYIKHARMVHISGSPRDMAYTFGHVANIIRHRAVTTTTLNGTRVISAPEAVPALLQSD